MSNRSTFIANDEKRWKQYFVSDALPRLILQVKTAERQNHNNNRSARSRTQLFQQAVNTLFAILLQRMAAFRRLTLPSSIVESLLTGIGTVDRVGMFDLSDNAFALPADDFDESLLTPRFLGSLHEAILQCDPFMSRKKKSTVQPNMRRRKSTGSFYTPREIVDCIVNHAVGPSLDTKLSQVFLRFKKLEVAIARQIGLGHRASSSIANACENGVRDIFDFKVCDPAMGTGYFLIEAARFMARRIVECLLGFPLLCRVWLQGDAVHLPKGDTTSVEPLIYRATVVRIIEQCLYGVDLNPTAVAIARACLWIEAESFSFTATRLELNLKAGDSLDGACASQRFDCVIGNPPYLGHRGDVDVTSLRSKFRVCREQSNLATAFLELSCSLLKPGGRLGLIVPKSIQYVDTWLAARQLVCRENRLEMLIDVSQAFDNVRLEQSIIIVARDRPATQYAAGELTAGGRLRQINLPVELAETLQCLPAKIEPVSLDIFRRISRLGPCLAAISRTTQALGYQARINRDTTGQSSPILRGRQIRPLRIDPPVDWIDATFLTARGGGFTEKVRQLLRPKVVTQNIIAHVTRPQSRLCIISAPDDAGTLCLNTVSTTLIHDGRFDHRYISIVLNSSLASWFYREFVFCRAVRTMHFDDYYAGKLPVALVSELDRSGLLEWIKRVAYLERRERQKAIDDFVFDAYQLSTTDRRFIVDYCYGKSGYSCLKPSLPGDVVKASVLWSPCRFPSLETSRD